MKKKNGFTLVELIAAITILGVLLLIGSQVVMDTMNKNKTKAVYASIDNVTKQARLTFLENPELATTGNTEYRKAITYNSNDLEIDRGGQSRIICVALKDTGKFKNLKLDYFLGNKNTLYCAHDHSKKPVWYFTPRKTYASLKDIGFIEVFKYDERDEDYIFYLADQTTEACPVKEGLNNSDDNMDSYKVDGKELEQLKNKRVSSICKVFISLQEFNKYRVK